MPRKRPIPPSVLAVQGLSQASEPVQRMDLAPEPEPDLSYVDDFTGEVRQRKAVAKPAPKARARVVTMVEPEPKAVQAQRVLEDAGLRVRLVDKLVAPHRPGMRVSHVMQTSDGPVAMYVPVKPLRRI